MKNKRTISRAACVAQHAANGDTSLIPQIEFKKDWEYGVTLVGRVVTKPEMDQQIGKFTLGLLTPEQKHMYCQIETHGDLGREAQTSLAIGSVVVVRGSLHSFYNNRLIISAIKLAHVVNPPIKIATILPPPLSKSQIAQDEVPEDTEGKWQHLLQNPDAWWDMREDNEEGSKRPAFKHRRAQRRALWISNYTPQSYLQAIESGECKVEKFPGWKMLLSCPTDYWNNQYNRKTEKFPHFIHKSTGTALWYDANRATPEQIAFYNNALNPEYQGARPTDPWEDLLQHPDNWVGKRSNKANGNAPDFKNIQFAQQGQQYGLWLDSCPQNILDKLSEQKSSFELTFAA